MRKLYCLIIFVASMSFVACKGTGNKTNEQTANDSVQVADTLSADSVAQNVEQKRRRKILHLVARVILKTKIWSPCA